MPNKILSNDELRAEIAEDIKRVEAAIDVQFFRLTRKYSDDFARLSDNTHVGDAITVRLLKE